MTPSQIFTAGHVLIVSPTIIIFRCNFVLCGKKGIQRRKTVPWRSPRRSAGFASHACLKSTRRVRRRLAGDLVTAPAVPEANEGISTSDWSVPASSERESRLLLPAEAAEESGPGGVSSPDEPNRF